MGKIKELVNHFTGDCYVFWSSPNVGRYGREINLEYVNLNIIYRLSNGKLVFIQTTGSLEHNQHNQQRVLYRLGMLRVRGGKRNNLVVRPTRLHVNEQADMADCIRVLEPDKSVKAFIQDQVRDSSRLSMLIRAKNERQIYKIGDKLPMPSMFKRVRNYDGLEPRITGELINLLKQLGGFDETDNPVDAFRKCRDRLYTLDGRGNYIFDFAHVDGRGIVMLGIEDMLSDIYEIPLNKLDTTETLYRIRLRDDILALDKKLTE